MEIFDNMDNGSSQDIRQDEINGEQHSFHSLPKEFQGWHNTQYMLEKKVPIDESTIPESQLNGYMWQAIGDASKFGMTSVTLIVFSVIKLKLAPNIYGLIISLLIFMPWALYSMYHVVFYAKIRAQVVGPVTINGYKYTSKIYFDTYYSIIGSMTIAFLFLMSIIEDILVVIQDMLSNMDPESMNSSYFKESLVGIYNFFMDLILPPNDLFGQILFNTYFSTGLFVTLMIGMSVAFERYIYNNRKEVVEQELVNESDQTGYPIDVAKRKMEKWRSEQ